jgi:hypothetical protein
MGQWVRCTLETSEKPGEQKVVRHLNLDYYVRMERNPNNTTLLRGRRAFATRLSRIWRASSSLRVSGQPKNCIDDDLGRTLDDLPDDIEVDP